MSGSGRSGHDRGTSTAGGVFTADLLPWRRENMHEHVITCGQGRVLIIVCSACSAGSAAALSTVSECKSVCMCVRVCENVRALVGVCKHV